MNPRSPQRSTILTLTCGAFLAINIFILSILTWRVFVVEGNHWSFDHSILIWPLAAQVLGLLTIRITQKNPTGLVTLTSIIGVLTLVASWVCIEWNLLVPYHQWIKRGMPAPWTRGASANQTQVRDATSAPAIKQIPEGKGTFGKLTKKDILKFNPTVKPSSKNVQVNLEPSCKYLKTINEGHSLLSPTDKEQYEAIQELIYSDFLHDTHNMVYDFDNNQVLVLTHPSFKNYAQMQTRFEGFDIPITVRPTCRDQEHIIKLLESVRAYIKDHDPFHELMSTGIEPTNSAANVWLKDFSYGLKQKIERAYGENVIVWFFDPERDEL